MKIYENGSKLDINLNRISIASYFIVIIFGLFGYLFIYMDITFLITAIMAGIGLINEARESVKATFIISSTIIVANILRTALTYPEYPTPPTFIPYYDITNHLWSVIILTYIGIIMVIVYYRYKEKYTLFSLSCAFGTIVFLKILAMNLLIYFSPEVENYNEYINPSHLIILIIILSGIGAIILSIANKKVHQLIFLGIILGLGIIGLNIWFFIPILPNFMYLYESDTAGLVYIEICSFVAIIWILIMISLLIYVVVENWNDIIKITKQKGQIIEKQEDSKING